jgi:hypothetical protein
MSPDRPWVQPSPVALDLIERVYRLASTLRVLEINPGTMGIAMVISLQEAFVLLDLLKSQWRMAVWSPSPAKADFWPGIDTVLFDLTVLPKPGLKWGILFGITLIVDEGDEPDTPRNK